MTCNVALFLQITALLIPFAQLLQQSQDCEGVPEDECFDRLEFLRRGGWIYDEDRKLCGSVQDRPVLIDMPGVAASFQGENGLVMLDVLTPVLRKLSAYFADEHAAFGEWEKATYSYLLHSRCS